MGATLRHVLKIEVLRYIISNISIMYNSGRKKRLIELGATVVVDVDVVVVVVVVVVIIV